MVNYEVSVSDAHRFTSSSAYIDTLTGFSTYVNGDQVLGDRTRYRQDTPPGDGELVIGVIESITLSK